MIPKYMTYEIRIGECTKPEHKPSLEEMCKQFKQSVRLIINGTSTKIYGTDEEYYVKVHLRETLKLGDNFPLRYIEVPFKWKEGYRFIIFMPSNPNFCHYGFMSCSGEVIV